MDMLMGKLLEIVPKSACSELRKGLKKPQNRVFLLRQNYHAKDVFFYLLSFSKSEYSNRLILL